jgi:hypothetical protein
MVPANTDAATIAAQRRPLNHKYGTNTSGVS